MTIDGGRPVVTAWPVRLRHGEIELRPLSWRDGPAWREVRLRNRDWLKPWDATAPPDAAQRSMSFRTLTRELGRSARRGESMPFALVVEGRFRGQVTVNNIVRGSAQFGSIGYWLDSAVAGRSIMPTAVAMVIDHCFTAARLHRIEIAIRPENTNSLRVVEKLGLREVGFAPLFLHIDGAWRDHRIFAVTVEDCPEGMLRRLQQHQSR